MLYHVINGQLIDDDEFQLRGSEIAAAVALASASNTSRSLAMADFELTLAPAASADFVEIGFGKPLTILIEDVYTGRLPRRQQRKPLLVTSAVKGLGVTQAVPRALNYAKRIADHHSRLKVPDATEEGTRLVAYYPSITSSAVTATFEILVNDFDAGFFEAIGDAFLSAGKLPIFLPASVALLAAGGLFKIGARLADVLVDGTPDWVERIELRFNLAGGNGFATAGHKILSNVPITGFSFVPDAGLVDAAGNPYAGEEPYLVLSLDGRDHDAEWKDFAALQVTSAQLEKFLNLKDGRTVAVTEIVEGLRLLNDVKYRSDFDQTGKQIARLEASGNSPEIQRQIAELKARRDAVLKNIQTDLLKPAE